MVSSTKPESTEHGEVRERYLRDLKLSNLARVAFFAAAGMFFAWAIPFLPRGLDPGSYAGPAVLAVMLACLAVGLAIVSMTYFLRATRRREVLLTWSAIFDETTGLHNRQYFIDRLELEMARATVESHSFRVFLLQARRQGRNGQPERLAREELAAIAKTMREELDAYDTLAVLGPDELAVLAPCVVPTVVERTDEKLLHALRGVFAQSHKSRSWRLRLGSVTFDGQASDPARLIDEMRIKLRTSPAIVLRDDDVA